jgi:hypothetical protein
MSIRLEPIGTEPILQEQQVGRYKVQVIRSMWGGLAYRILLDGQKVRCWSDADERTFPKRAAKVGTMLVEQYESQGVLL